MDSTESRLTGAENELDMDPFIWQRLPGDILEVVLTKLPLATLKTFSGVSKSWKALIHSEEFAHRCQSSEPTVFNFGGYSGKTYIAVPNLKTGFWEKHILEFLPENEAVDFIGTSEGLLCYMVTVNEVPPDLRYSTSQRDLLLLGEMALRPEIMAPKPLHHKEIFLVVHNPFTRKWRRFVVPYTFETGCLDGMLGGLAVDQDTGSYKVVLAFIGNDSPRTTYIYDSGANSWSVSAALSPALTKFDFRSPWILSGSGSICCDGELYWSVEEEGRGPKVKFLIKYSIELDTWFTMRQNQYVEVHRRLHLTSFQKRPVIVNLLERSNVFLDSEEFSGSGRNLARFDSEDFARLIQAADHQGESSKLELKRGLATGEPYYSLETALAECETWFIFYRDFRWDLLCLKLEAGSVTQLPVHPATDRTPRSRGTFAARLNAFV